MLSPPAPSAGRRCPHLLPEPGPLLYVSSPPPPMSSSRRSTVRLLSVQPFWVHPLL